LLMVVVRLTRFGGMARAMPGSGEDYERKGGLYWFRDYMLSKDLSEQEEDKIGNTSGGLDAGG
jgi:hypothetical protein